ncbi:lysophospholipid acyltransferase family protein [Pseudorhodoferax sp.]|uniref:lysophospholipid acyltransferase family protein n=1 Tax=Pseudorhodoferax sp. TaxID=1993553 RepID=UPI002DD69EBC|nr:lysophospholipid acyltransferase family protein [Pseudorhodoferax sp.]
MPVLRSLRGVQRLAAVLLHGVHGLLIVLLRFPSLNADGRQQRVRWWSAGMLRRLGITLHLQGRFKPGAKLLVANHVSWLDILVVHAVCPEARFVSKAEVRQWPLVGRLVAAGNTLYLARERKRDALRVVHQAAEALQAGDTVAVFPEGTTGPGGTLLPFHANLLQAAIASGCAVQPLALRYADRQQPFSAAAQWLGDTTLAQTLWRLATADVLQVHLQVLPARGSRHADRRRLAETLAGDIAAVLDAARPVA